MKDFFVSAEKQLECFKKYPVLFEYALSPKSMKNIHPITLFHIECWKGWMPLIEVLSFKIFTLDINQVMRVEQIKQKFAGLRYYITWINERPKYFKDIYNLVNEYQNHSFEVCEVCGNSGDRVKEKEENYILTLCDECLKLEDFKNYIKYNSHRR
jgi:hypothetical protein